jgi:hypothetical protein
VHVNHNCHFDARRRRTITNVPPQQDSWEQDDNEGLRDREMRRTSSSPPAPTLARISQSSSGGSDGRTEASERASERCQFKETSDFSGCSISPAQSGGGGGRMPKVRQTSCRGEYPPLPLQRLLQGQSQINLITTLERVRRTEERKRDK